MSNASDRLLQPERVSKALDAAGWSGPFPTMIMSTESTNADVVALARAGAPGYSCVVAEEQTAGRGRLDRQWVSPRSGGVWMSVLVPMDRCDRARWTWLPLLTGLAARDAVVKLTGAAVHLKWPNDLVVDEMLTDGTCALRKVGGVLSEQVAGMDVAIVGVGINVALSVDELPTLESTSLLLQGVDVAREDLVAQILIELQRRVDQLCGGDHHLEEDYRAACTSFGREVRVALPGGDELRGTAKDVDADGALVVNTPEGNHRTVTAGDVIHATIAP